MQHFPPSHPNMATSPPKTQNNGIHSCSKPSDLAAYYVICDGDGSVRGTGCRGQTEHLFSQRLHVPRRDNSQRGSCGGGGGEWYNKKKYLYPGCLSASKCREVLICNILQGSLGHLPWLQRGREPGVIEAWQCDLVMVSGLADWIPLGNAHIYVDWTYWLAPRGGGQKNAQRVIGLQPRHMSDRSSIQEGGGIRPRTPDPQVYAFLSRINHALVKKSGV